MIKFYRGLRESYSEQHYNGIYFATDTGEILHGGKSYSTIENSSGKYKSNIEDKQLEMPETVGGIKKGTKVTDLEGKPYDYILDDLLFPTVYPTYIEPSATLLLKSTYNAIQEVGSEAPTLESFIAAYNPGSILINGKKQNNRGGEDDQSEIIFEYGSELPTKIDWLGNRTYIYTVTYKEGPQPLTNKGNHYDKPLPAGSVYASVQVNGTLPWYASTDEALVKQPLIAWDDNGMVTDECKLIPHSDKCPQIFMLPRQATKLEMYNSVANSFDEVSLDDWSVEEMEYTSHLYYIYTYKGSDRGSVTLRINF